MLSDMLYALYVVGAEMRPDESVQSGSPKYLSQLHSSLLLWSHSLEAARCYVDRQELLNNRWELRKIIIKREHQTI